MTIDRPRFSPKDLPKALVILGAGANKRIEGFNQSAVRAWDPPLAKDLFGANLKYQSWRSIYESYTGAVAVGGRIERQMRSGSVGLEQALREAAEHDDPTVQDNYKHVPPYIRDLLARVSNDYTSSPTTLIELCSQLLSDNPHNVAFVTTNYDTFLEQALRIHDRSTYEFGNVHSYIDDSRQAKVYKIHGSTNWYTEVVPHPQGWDYAVMRREFDPQEIRRSIKVWGDTSTPVSTLNYNSRFWYPVLTAPLAGKDKTALVCPSEHEQSLRDFIKDCPKVLTIGNSGLDEDLLGLLNDDLLNPRLFQAVGQDKADSMRITQRYLEGVRSIRALRSEPQRLWPSDSAGTILYIKDRLESFASMVAD